MQTKNIVRTNELGFIIKIKIVLHQKQTALGPRDSATIIYELRCEALDIVTGHLILNPEAGLIVNAFQDDDDAMANFFFEKIDVKTGLFVFDALQDLPQPTNKED